MPLTPGGIFTGQGKRAHIRNDESIHAGVIQLFQIGRKTVYFFVPGHGIHGYVHLDIVTVGKADCLGQFLRSKVSGKGTHPKAGTGQIYSICAV